LYIESFLSTSKWIVMQDALVDHIAVDVDRTGEQMWNARKWQYSLIPPVTVPNHHRWHLLSRFCFFLSFFHCKLYPLLATSATIMDPNGGGVRKMEDSDNPDSKRDVKPQVKTLNRVPRMFHWLFIIQYPLIFCVDSRGLCKNSLSCVWR
jgi:hypothetical protein